MKHTLKFLEINENYDKSIRTQIETTLKSINKKEIDLSKIDILSFDSEIIKSIIVLFRNLLSIRRKFLLLDKFKKFMVQTTGSDDITQFRNYFNEIKRYKKLNLFKENALKSLGTGKTKNKLGDSFVKINFSSQGKAEHFYKLNEEEKCLLVFNSKTSKSSCKFYFEKDIFQIKYGVKSKNLIKRYKDFKTPQFKQPWLYMSFIMNKSSIDLFMNEEQIINWFFGLNEMKIKNGLTNLKIMTCRGFVVKKLKLKLIQKLKDDLIFEEKTDEGKEDNIKKMSSIKKDMVIVTQMKKFLKVNQLGLDQLSFAKVLLLYIKFFDVKFDSFPKKD